jgi:TolA-binding protein
MAQFMHDLGNVRFAQGRDNESHQMHMGALDVWPDTYIGEHPRVGDLLVKVGDHSVRLGHGDKAM